MFKHNEVKQHRGWIKLVLVIIPTVLVFTGVSIFAVNQWYNDNLQPLSSEQAKDVVVVIESGTSVRDIGDQLKDLGVIRNSTVFSWYVGRQDSRGELQAGTYRLNPAQSVEDIVDKIVSGDVATNLYTILPARRLDQLQSDFIDFGFNKSEVEAAFNRRYDHPLFDSAPPNISLEGYIFPETYKITVDTSVSDILVKSFDQMDSKLTPELKRGLDNQGLTLHRAIILASIIEREGGSASDLHKIAQVFLKRLDEGIVLGSDATFVYAAAVSGQKATPELDSPYNTRINAGLPPGPISNFNLTSIEAVASPAATDFLYFVSGDDGITYFSKTLAEHESLTAKYCVENCKLPE